MNVFPHTMANGRNHIGTMAGKLKGVMAAQLRQADGRSPC